MERNKFVERNKFCFLFDGNRTAIGKVWGESVFIAKDGPTWADLIDEHLNLPSDDHSAGVYPLVKKGDLPSGGEAARTLEQKYGFTSELWVKWGCSDLDEGYEQSAKDAQTLVQAFVMLNIEAFVERTKGKGYHVWVFAEQFVPAEVMRRAFLAAHQAAGIRPQEVNPKQTSLEGLGRGLGNYVNLPYAASAEADKRVVMYADWSGTMSAEAFTEEAMRHTASFETLLQAGRLYVEPPKRRQHDIQEYDGSLEDLTQKLNGLAFIIFRDGPLEGHDRSDTLAKFCHKARESGLTAGECMTLLRNADKRWGKFYDRPDCDQQLEGLVNNAYT